MSPLLEYADYDPRSTKMVLRQPSAYSPQVKYESPPMSLLLEYVDYDPQSKKMADSIKGLCALADGHEPAVALPADELFLYSRWIKP